jgi:hypothetical protein
VALLQIDLSDAISWNPALSSDDAHEISHLHPVARPDRHEESDHPAGGGAATSARALAFSRSWFGGRRLVRIGLTSLGALTL